MLQGAKNNNIVDVRKQKFRGKNKVTDLSLLIPEKHREKVEKGQRKRQIKEYCAEKYEMEGKNKQNRRKRKNRVIHEPLR